MLLNNEKILCDFLNSPLFLPKISLNQFWNFSSKYSNFERHFKKYILIYLNDLNII